MCMSSGVINNKMRLKKIKAAHFWMWQKILIFFLIMSASGFYCIDWSIVQRVFLNPHVAIFPRSYVSSLFGALTVLRIAKLFHILYAALHLLYWSVAMLGKNKTGHLFWEYFSVPSIYFYIKIDILNYKNQHSFIDKREYRNI